MNGIEDSDFILLIGTNPRFEATIVNARIRKSYLNNNTKIVSVNNVGDLTYPYKSLDGKTKTIKDIFEGNHSVSNEIISSKKPMIIIGESLLNNESANYLFSLIKKFLLKNEKISENWNSLNILSTDAATVGNLDLDLINKNQDLIKNLYENKFEIVYLLGQDNLNFNKKNEFIIYQGSHGDIGAEIADVILPAAAYTEQSGHYTNLEGKIQKSYKASYPPGKSKEDWEILNNLAELMNSRKLFNDKNELESSMFNYLNLKKENENKIKENLIEGKFIDQNLSIKFKEYYFSNVIARASKTMLDCYNSKLDIKKTGTEG
ncbi:molybdopterin-dependent oxidoreductase [Candidatus Pelagibacter sp.]|nr:molybdopterin-dependent oxidoreductase [Candidatus Pelagibacter sp.]